MKMKDEDAVSSAAREAGLTLVEVLIAAAIFSMVTLTAYALVFRARLTHDQLDTDVTQQRNVRFALDRMIETLRSAGANVNPAGDLSIPDEQIEGAWESAIVVRADFDGQRELALEGAGERRIVTTGNHEIAGYVLGKSGTLPSSIAIAADLTGPSGKRDAFLDEGAPLNEETRIIPVSAVTLAEQTEPPYQLIRISFNGKGELVRELVADDIFQLRFRYYDRNGALLDPVNLGGADGAAQASRLARGEIRQIEIDLVGMSERPGPGYDPAVWSPDPASAKRHRKFPLSARIDLLNAGAVGRDHGPVPSVSVVAPHVVTGCHGHCARIVVTWPAVPGMNAYQVHVSASGVDTTHDVIGSTTLVYTTPDPESTYTFSVRAWDTVFGVFSDFSPAVSLAPTHQLPSNTPAGVPSPPVVTPDGSEYALRMTWERVGENIASLPSGTCVTSDGSAADAGPPFDRKLVDLETYEIHRARADGGAGFPVGTDTRVDELEPNLRPMTALSFTDRLASPCQLWYYRIRASDSCEVAGALSPPMTLAVQFDLPSDVVPAAPEALHSNPPLEESVVGGAEVYVVSLEWPDVISTAPPEAKPVAVAHYVVERTRRLAGAASFSYDGRIDVYERNQVVDVVPRTVSGRAAAYRYAVIAQFDCTSSGLRASEPSPSLEVPLP